MSDSAVVEGVTVALRSLGYEVSAVDLAEILWLAPFLPGTGRDIRVAAPSSSPAGTGAATGGSKQDKAPADGGENDPPPPPPETGPGGQPGLYPSTDRTSTGLARRASIVRAPAPPALPNALSLSRALRPLLKKRISTRESELDEAATVDATAANGGIVSPVFRPGAERWFEVALVVDESPSMFIWRQAIVELRRLLTRHGGFRDLRQYGLRLSGSTAELITESGRRSSPSVIADPSGHRLIVIVTDAISTDWLQAPVRRAIFNWARLSPVVMIDVLPRRMWPLTTMGFAERPMHAPRAGAANIEWAVERDWWATSAPSVAVPVISLEAQQFAQWARSLMQVSAATCTGTLIGTDAVRARAAGTTENEVAPTAAERVQRFRSSASPGAYQLACYFSATQLVLPILRIVQQEMMPGSGLGHLAEFLTSGLIARVETAAGVAALDPERAAYEFLPGVRDVLIDQLQLHEAERVQPAIEEYLRKHLGESYDLRVLRLDAAGGEAVSADALPVLKNAIDLLVRMGLRPPGTDSLDALIDAASAAFDSKRVLSHIARDLPVLRGYRLEQQREYMLMAAIELMPEEQRGRLAPLGVTAPVDVIPPILWRALFNEADIRPLDAMEGLVKTPANELRVHPEVRSTLYRHSSQDQQRLHERIVAAYRDAATPRVSRIPEDDGYYYEHYFEHLAAIGDEKTAEDLALDADWISRKIQSCGVASLVADLARFPDNKTLREMKEAADRKHARWEDPLEWAESLLRDWSNGPDADAEYQARQQANQAADAEVAAAAAAPPALRVLVTGTGGRALEPFEHAVTEQVGEALGRADIGLVNGAWPGVDEVVSDRFLGARREAGLPMIRGALTQMFAAGEQRRAHDHADVKTYPDGQDFAATAIEQVQALVIIGGMGYTRDTANTADRAVLPVIPIAATGGDAAAVFADLVETGEYFDDDALNADPASDAAVARIGARVVSLVRERSSLNLRLWETARAYATSRRVNHDKCEERILLLLRRSPDAARAVLGREAANLPERVLQALAYRVAPSPARTASLVEPDPSIPLTLARLKALESAFAFRALRASIPPGALEPLRASYNRLDDEERGPLAGQAKILLAQKLLPLARLILAAEEARDPKFSDLDRLRSPLVTDRMALDCLEDPHPGWRLVGLLWLSRQSIPGALTRIIGATRLESTFETHIRVALDAIVLAVDDVAGVLRSQEEWHLLTSFIESHPEGRAMLRHDLVAPPPRPTDPPALSRPNLEKIVRDHGLSLNIERFQRRLATIEPCVCRVQLGPSFATGFLVGQDLVLTAYHVVEACIDDVRRDRSVESRPLSELTVQFDYASAPGRPRAQAIIGQVIDVVDYSPYDPGDLTGRPFDSPPAADLLDYALLRLAGPVRERGGATGDRPPGLRMGIAVPPNDLPIEPGAPLMAVHCPEGRPPELVIGTIGSLNSHGTRISYELQTRVGSSGTPCFTRDLELVALHHRRLGREREANAGEGVAIAAIRDMLRRRGKLDGVNLARWEDEASSA